jgi:hypothetical protein
MSSLDEAVEQLRIKKAAQAYELADLVLQLNEAFGRSDNQAKVYAIHKKMVALAVEIRGYGK